MVSVIDTLEIVLDQYTSDGEARRRITPYGGFVSRSEKSKDACNAVKKLQDRLVPPEFRLFKEQPRPSHDRVGFRPVAGPSGVTYPRSRSVTPAMAVPAKMARAEYRDAVMSSPMPAERTSYDPGASGSQILRPNPKYQVPPYKPGPVAASTAELPTFTAGDDNYVVDELEQEIESMRSSPPLLQVRRKKKQRSAADDESLLDKAGSEPSCDEGDVDESILDKKGSDEEESMEHF